MAISTLAYNSTSPYKAPTGVSIDNTRRLFNFGERVAELDPVMSPFFTYLAKVRRRPTDDPVFKFLEERHQWQRQNFTVKTAVTWTTDSNGDIDTGEGDNLVLTCGYNEYGKIQANSGPRFLKSGDVIAIKDNGGTVRRIRLTAAGTVSGTNGTDGIVTFAITLGVGATAIGATWPTSSTVTFAAGALGQKIGNAFAEGVGTPLGWRDELADVEGFTQIFRTAMPMMSGTQMSTRYRGRPDEWQRTWGKKLKEHKMDLEHASLFGYGSSAADESASTAAPLRYTWGMLPYVDLYGKNYAFSYASSGYDAFLDAMEDYFAPEGGNSGNKLVLASRKVITFLNKMGDSGFLKNTVGSSAYRLDVQNIKGAFGHEVTKVNNIFGSLHFIQEPLLRGPWEDYAICVDLANVAWRPLIGNGKSRDTFIKTNVQDNGSDGRVDEILTEAGLQIDLAETHATLKFS
jgi:hypothetical protein